MKQKSLNTLYAYWNELRAGRLAPKRLEVEPSRIAGLLSETFMLERAGASNYQYRLAGTRLCELFGAELRSTNFLAGWREADQPVVARQLSLLCEQGAVIELGIEARGSARRPPLLFDALLLPLLHTGNTVGRIIGAMCAGASRRDRRSARAPPRQPLGDLARRAAPQSHRTLRRIGPFPVFPGPVCRRRRPGRRPSPAARARRRARVLEAAHALTAAVNG